jgi:hypothetical protein
MMQSQQKKKSITYTNDNILEQLRSVSSDVPVTAIDTATKIGTDVLTSLFGGAPQMGELRPNEAIQLGEAHTEATPEVHAPRVEVHVAQPNVSELDMQTKQQIEAIRVELKAIAQSLKGLHQEVLTAVETAPVDPGIYHLNFFEQLRSFLKLLRVQIEDSRSWLSTSNSRKKKLGYWGMYKKHGTTFGLSNERSLATSAG